MLSFLSLKGDIQTSYLLLSCIIQANRYISSQLEGILIHHDIIYQYLHSVSTEIVHGRKHEEICILRWWPCLLERCCPGPVCWNRVAMGRSAGTLLSWAGLLEPCCHGPICWNPVAMGRSAGTLLSWAGLLEPCCHGPICWNPVAMGRSAGTLLPWAGLLEPCCPGPICWNPVAMGRSAGTLLP